MGDFVSVKPPWAVPPVEPEPLPDPEDDPPPLVEPPPAAVEPPELEPPELDPALPEPLPAEPLPGCELLAPGELGLVAGGVLRLDAELSPVPPQLTMKTNEHRIRMARTDGGLQRMGPPTTVKREQVLWWIRLRVSAPGLLRNVNREVPGPNRSAERHLLKEILGRATPEDCDNAQTDDAHKQ